MTTELPNELDTARPHKKRATNEHVEKGGGVSNSDNRIQVQLDEGGDGSRQNWMEKSDLWAYLCSSWSEKSVSMVYYSLTSHSTQ